MDIVSLKKRLQSIPNPFTSNNLIGSAHEEGMSSGSKNRIKIRPKGVFVGSTELKERQPKSGALRPKLLDKLEMAR